MTVSYLVSISFGFALTRYRCCFTYFSENWTLAPHSLGGLLSFEQPFCIGFSVLIGLGELPLVPAYIKLTTFEEQTMVLAGILPTCRLMATSYTKRYKSLDIFSNNC